MLNARMGYLKVRLTNYAVLVILAQFTAHLYSCLDLLTGQLILF
jgi:hypothetical protein